MTNFAPGDSVRARGREWVALPTPQDGTLALRPLSGSENDTVKRTPPASMSRGRKPRKNDAAASMPVLSTVERFAGLCCRSKLTVIFSAIVCCRHECRKFLSIARWLLVKGAVSALGEE